MKNRFRSKCFDVLNDCGAVVYGMAETEADSVNGCQRYASICRISPRQESPKNLRKRNIGVRDGHMYSPRLMKRLGLALESGAVRASLVHYNTLKKCASSEALGGDDHVSEAPTAKCTRVTNKIGTPHADRRANPARFAPASISSNAKSISTPAPKGALSDAVQAGLEDYIASWHEQGSPWELWVNRYEDGANCLLRNSSTPARTRSPSITSVSAGINGIASALSFRERKKVVMGEFEFPTMGHVWLAQRARGAEVQFVSARRQSAFQRHNYEEMIDRNTLHCAAHARLFQERIPLRSKRHHANRTLRPALS